MITLHDEVAGVLDIDDEKINVLPVIIFVMSEEEYSEMVAEGDDDPS